METILNSKEKIARRAGLLYLALAITSAYGLMYVSSQVYVPGDVAATSRNMMTNEFIFRSGIVSNLISQTIFVFLVLALYRLFEQVNKHQATVMVALVVASVPIVFVGEVFHIISLMILKGEVLSTLQPDQQQEWTMLFLKLNSRTTLVAEVFWGLWLIPFGQLAYRSGFIPKIIGVLLILGGIAYVIQVAASLLFPEYQSIVSKFTGLFPTVAELSTILWLLIKGVKSQQSVSAGKVYESKVS